MSRVKLFVVSLFLFSFMLCMLGVPTQAQIGPGGDMPGAGGNTIGAGGDVPVNGPDTPGPGGDTPSDNPLAGDSGILGGPRPLVLTPLEPVVVGPEVGAHQYEVFNATPGGEVFILKGFEFGKRDSLLCLNLKLNIANAVIENILIADPTGYANSTISVPKASILDVEALYMQALDVESCKKSNVTVFDF